MIKSIRHRLTIPLVAAIAALLLVVVACADNPNPQGPPNTLESIGIRAEPARGVPQVSQAAAIAAAERWGGGLSDRATTVTTQFVLFSDDHNYTELPSGEKIRDVPAWLITFEGLEMRAFGGCFPYGCSDEERLRFNTELNVVIDARTGDLVEAFAYR
jgi:hypothetical protein